MNGKVYSSERNITIVEKEDAELTAVFIEQLQGAPSFRIAHRSEHVSSPRGSTQTFVIRLENVGDVTGDAKVKILDNGRTITGKLVTLQPERREEYLLRNTVAQHMRGVHVARDCRKRRNWESG